MKTNKLNSTNMDFKPKDILKKSFVDLWWKNIPDLEISSDEVKREYLKYHYLLLNFLYFDKNDLDFSTKILNNSTKNVIKHSRSSVNSLLSEKRKWKIMESFDSKSKKTINEKLLSLPLFYMWEYLDKNLDELKQWNSKQIEFAEFFWLSHMQDIKTIAEILWFNWVLNWYTINLPLDTFKWLKNEIDSLEASGVLWSINWNSLLLSIASTLRVENFENLYYWVKSLWYEERMWVKNVKMPTKRMLNILNYTKDKYWKPSSDISWDNLLSFVLTETAIHKILEDNLIHFTNQDIYNLKQSQITQIKSNIRSALRWFWYRLEIDNNR